MPQVSVILPVYDGARTIARAAHSILDQTFRDLELIVVDDGSSDETLGIVQQISDPRLRVIKGPHREVAAAANAGLAIAEGEFIARMDADDFSHPRRIARQLQLIREGSFDAVGCRVNIVDQRQEAVASMGRYRCWINEETADSQNIHALRFVEFPLVNPTILARRKYFELKFREGEFPEDYDLMLRAARLGMRFGKVGEILFDWTDAPGRLTRTNSRYTPAAFDRCRRAHLILGPLEHVNRIDLWGLGQTGKPWLHWCQDQDIVVRRGYDVNHRKIGTRIHGVRVSHPDDMPAADGTPLLIAVGARGARELIAGHIQTRGYISGRTAWFVA